MLHTDTLVRDSEYALQCPRPLDRQGKPCSNIVNIATPISLFHGKHFGLIYINRMFVASLINS